MSDKKNSSSKLLKKGDIQKNPDKKIDQDFEGYPNGPAKDETIKPKTKSQKETADLDNKDGEKKFDGDSSKNKPVIDDEQESDGSANAFEGK